MYILFFLVFFVTKTENSGVGVIASYLVGFYIFIYFKKYFILLPYRIRSFLRYSETLFQFFCNIKNNLNFSEKSHINKRICH